MEAEGGDRIGVVIRRMFLVVVMLLLTVNVAGAQDYGGPKTDHIAGGLEKVIEKVSLYTKFSKKGKTEHMEKLLDKRLAELAYAVANDRDKVETSASRYSSYMGNLTSYVVKYKVSGEKDDILNLYSQHGEYLVALRDEFEANSGWWLAIQHCVNNADWLGDGIEKL